jgi:hypothetical protein
MVVVGGASAAVLYESGFERSESFIAGTGLDGQANWTATGTDQYWVSDAISNTGTQSVMMTAGSDFNDDWAWTPINYDTSLAVVPTVVAEVDMYVDAPNTQTSDGFSGLDAYTPTVDRIAQVTVDFATGSLTLRSGETGSEVSTADNVWVFGQYNRLGLKLDYLTGLATATLNGTDLGLQVNLDATRYVIGDVDLRGSFGAGGTTELVSFDNYSVTSADVVPEPATMALLAAGAAAFVGRRRRR